MIRFESILDARAWVVEAQRAGRVVGIVPTMGALHEGHLSLVRAAASDCDAVIASVFVNPTQFGPSEDYQRYPRDIEADAESLAGAGAGALFAPSVDEMYPSERGTVVDVGEIATVLEGAARPTHFSGVATVVLKLLQIAPADRAYFGQKDYQQTVVIRQVVRDLNVATRVVVCPTVRDSDGLALSSRNAYLSPEERRDALVLSDSLRIAERLVSGGERNVAVVRDAVLGRFGATPAAELDYAEFLAEGTVRSVDSIDGPVVLAIAARVGGTRLLDNAVLRVAGGS